MTSSRGAVTAATQEADDESRYERRVVGRHVLLRDLLTDLGENTPERLARDQLTDETLEGRGLPLLRPPTTGSRADVPIRRASDQVLSLDDEGTGASARTVQRQVGVDAP